MSGDRPTSILTESQRDYIQGKHQPSNPREYNRRIRNRIEYGLFDLRLLFDNLEQDEVRKAFGSNTAQRLTNRDEAHGDPKKGPATSAYIPSAIAFFLRGLNYGDKQIVEGLEGMNKQQPAFTDFVKAAERGIELYLRDEKDYLADVSVTIELENLSPTEEFLESLSEKGGED